MTTLFLDIVNFALLLGLISHCLYKKKSIDQLIPCAWKAFAIMVPLFGFSSLILGRESAFYFFSRIAGVAGILLCFQIVESITAYLPSILYSAINFVRAALRDFFVLITFFGLFRSRCWKQTPKKFAGNNIPILMIHGYGHDAGAWVHHGPLLEKAGFGPLYTIDLGSVENSIVNYAELVHKKAQGIAQEAQTPALFLIGYSMGGLVAAYYTFHFAPQGSVRGVITFGTPLDGTKTAVFGVGLSAQEMLYQSPFVKKLREQVANSPKIPFWHIGSWSEIIVRPPSSAWVKGVNSQNIVFDDIGHLSMLYSERITDCLCAILRTADSKKE